MPVMSSLHGASAHLREIAIDSMHGKINIPQTHLQSSKC